MNVYYKYILLFVHMFECRMEHLMKSGVRACAQCTYTRFCIERQLSRVYVRQLCSVALLCLLSKC